MPIYEYQCECGKAQEIVRRVAEHTKTIPCQCGKDARQKITACYHVMPDIQPYRSMITGERIKGRSHHRQHLRDHHMVEVGNERIAQKRSELPPVGPDIKRAIEEVRSR